MRTWVSRYTLVPRVELSALAGSRPREGALVRVGSGFGDLHPWPELGDLPLDAHLASIASGRPTSLASRTLDCAAADGEARESGISLLDELRIPPSHYAAGGGEIPDLRFLERAGFDRVKIKAGPDAAGEVERLNDAAASLLGTAIRLRIDFNASIALDELRAIFDGLAEGVAERIEFLEDPVPPDPGEWTAIRRRWRVMIAADRDKPDPACWDVAVVKPAWEPEDAIRNAIELGKRVVVTSAMDHPVGQMWAAWNAATAAKEYPGSILACGLLSHHAYEPNDFSDALATDGAVLRAPDGHGLGFDDLLERLAWTRLA